MPDDWTLATTADAISVYDNQNFRLINEIRVVSPGQDGTGVVRVDATTALRQHVATHYALIVKHTASGETWVFQNGALVSGNVEYPLTTAIDAQIEARLSEDPAIELVMVDTSLPAVDVANLRYADLATRAIRLTSLVRLEVAVCGRTSRTTTGRSSCRVRRWSPPPRPPAARPSRQSSAASG